MDELMLQMNLKLPRSLWDRLEAYRRRQPYEPSRTAVVRAMIERVLNEEVAQVLDEPAKRGAK